ncbi:hypothetical protein DER45DRAFT_165559 [Fusarium avenaceum]|nr:hypothetical protein DER45DRAFT_165559 [Fusarium avenaceum]
MGVVITLHSSFIPEYHTYILELYLLYMLKLHFAVYVLILCRFCSFRVTKHVEVCKYSYLGGVVRLCFVHEGHVSCMSVCRIWCFEYYRISRVNHLLFIFRGSHYHKILLSGRVCRYKKYIDGSVISIGASMEVVQDNEALEEVTGHSHSSCPY